MKYILTFCFIMLLALGACAQQEANTFEPMKEMGTMHHMMVESEQEFVIEMIPHHQEAVDTSKIIAQNTKNEQLRDLANRIIVAQEQEIEMMQGWSAAWYDPMQPTYQNMMPDLASLEGKAQDDAFLRGMIMHHMMAVHMAQSVLTLEPREEVAQFANDVIRVQTEEINEMQSLLAQ